jgi:UDP-N-acetylglucosamine transferase subunit ALG13
MILVTVGTEKFSFNRLMQWIDNLIKDGIIETDREEVVIQYGSCTVVPTAANNYSLLPENEFRNLLEKARLIIAHCGEGTIDMLAEITKPFVLVPRDRKYEEHVDDHQIELAEMLQEQGISIANSQEDLVNFLASPKVAPVVNAPSDYYAQACSILDAQFGGLDELQNLSPAWA